VSYKLSLLCSKIALKYCSKTHHISLINNNNIIIIISYNTGCFFLYSLSLEYFVLEIAIILFVGTSRGEAEGFALDILSKLKDVKSKVSFVV